MPRESPPSSPANSSATEEQSRAKTAKASTGNGIVTARAFLLGLLLSGGLAALNAWIEAAANVHFLSGVQMPLGAIFVLTVLVVLVNGPLRVLQGRFGWLHRIFPPFSSTELLVVYAMTTFGVLVSTLGNENAILTTGAALFYFSSRENGWADLFYAHIPRHFAPGWDGQRFQTEVIEPFYMGGVDASRIPWHAWAEMLITWSVFVLLVYGALFFLSLLLRKQWIENEALAFPLIQLPLQMVECGAGENAPPAREFWSNRGLWAGVALSAGFHLLRGLNHYFPDWPQISAFQGHEFQLSLTEVPWNSVGELRVEIFFGAIGVAYLLTRELSLSFWVFFLLYNLQLVLATQLGYPVGSLPKDTYLGRPTFIAWQSTGAWVMMAVLLLWSARGHLQNMWREAWYADTRRADTTDTEPFSARFTFIGLTLSFLGLMGWCWFAGLNPLATLAFFGLYTLTSIVVARLVVEGGMIFPHGTFGAIETLTGSVMGVGAMGTGTIVKLSFLQASLFSDLRANLLPGFLHTLKIAFDQRLDSRQTRRLLGCVLVSIVLTWGVATYTAIATLYRIGGLATYPWFSRYGSENAFNGATTMLVKQPSPSPENWGWLALGAGVVWLLTFARARYLWFPLHPLAYLVSSGNPIIRLWFSFFLGWAIKTLLLKFGGLDCVQRAHPFMIGLILGNVSAMMLWLFYGICVGNHIEFWPA